MRLRELLNNKGRAVTTVKSDAALSDVFVLLSTKGIGAVIVCDDDGQMVGIVSERDLVRVVAKKGNAALSSSVREAMTTNVVTCTEDETVDNVMQKMTDGRFRHMPVEVDGCIGGIISIGDVVKHHIEEIERDAAHMRAYISAV